MATAILSRLRELHESYTQQKALRRELATYTTEDDLNDLEAALDRYEYTETEGIRRILAQQRAGLS